MAGTPADADHGDTPVVTLRHTPYLVLPPADRRLPGGKAAMTGLGFLTAPPRDEAGP